jgi:signal transduction histidine kinase
MLPFTALLMLLALVDFQLPNIVYTHGTRIGYFFSVTTTLAALATHITALKLDHDRSLQQALEAAQRDAELSRQVLEAEQRYTRARELAAARHRQLAATSHDIRQPLTSLRAVVDRLPPDLGSRERDILMRSLDYIEDLSRAHVDELPRADDGDGDGDGDGDEHASQDVAESYRADLLLHTVKQMFDAESRAKGITLRVAPCSAVVCEPPLVLMRILGNLVANAVKHCTSGSVLLGCRRRGDGVSYEVIDTGPGIAPRELQRILEPYEKGQASGGEGLGLAICRQLAEAHGYALQVRSRVGAGTRFALHIPSRGG